jgi:DNA-binding phage protein
MLDTNRSASAATKRHNRVAAIMLHTSRYAFRGPSRLARDSGVSRSTICRLIHGRVTPLYSTISRVVKCFEAALGHPLNLNEVFSETGKYPTRSVCDLLGCGGCLPDWMYDDAGSRRPVTLDREPGGWTGDTTELERLTNRESA